MAVIENIADLVQANGKTRRENNLELKHEIPVGTLVEVNLSDNDSHGTRQFIASHGRDCDGTPLYILTTQRDKCDDKVEDLNDPNLHHYRTGGGWSDDCLIVLRDPKRETVPVIIVDIPTTQGQVVVKREDGLYTVSVGGIDKHPNGDADMALRAMGFYLHGTDHSLYKLQTKVSGSLVALKDLMKGIE